MKQYQKEFIEFLLSQKALTFGDFVTKSGRNTPYFVNTGKLFSGHSIKILGKTYAEHILEQISRVPELIFGPAYKGIPLAVTTAIALSEKGVNCNYGFDRKEVKDHGDGGAFVGKAPAENEKVVLVEDVVTAGTTLQKMVPILKNQLKCDLLGVCIAVDRCEKGINSDISAVEQSRQELGIKIKPILTIHQILEFLSTNEAKESSFAVEGNDLDRAYKYLEQYGAK